MKLFKISSIKNIIKNWKNPLYFRNAIVYKLGRFFYKDNIGESIFSEEWSNLIILDACRFDYFKKEFKKRNMAGSLYQRKSRGAHTVTFLRKNFTKDFYNDIVYITSNPHVDVILKNKFHKIISVWKKDWSDKYKTVLPSTMVDYILKALKKYPNKKLIIHFMQPHYPYLGYKLEEDPSGENETREFINLHGFRGEDKKVKNKCQDDLFSIYRNDIFRNLSDGAIMKVYEKNLNIVMEYVQKLIHILPGISIITADHGESLGERVHPILPIKFYGHTTKMNLPVLIKIPWLVIHRNEKNPGKFKKDLEERLKIKNIVKSLKL